MPGTHLVHFSILDTKGYQKNGLFVCLFVCMSRFSCSFNTLALINGAHLLCSREAPKSYKYLALPAQEGLQRLLENGVGV